MSLALQNIVPASELKCVWMDAGIVAYKLCERKYRCENCPLYAAIHKNKREIKRREDLTPISLITNIPLT
ncbi:MAG: hypothetical protein KGZ58_08590 [Ignavibacteriales bacterium]|nr:hypothetical protein [Ignavibacteriales bacterium]